MLSDTHITSSSSQLPLLLCCVTPSSQTLITLHFSTLFKVPNLQYITSKTGKSLPRYKYNILQTPSWGRATRSSCHMSQQVLYSLPSTFSLTVHNFHYTCAPSTKSQPSPVTWLALSSPLPLYTGQHKYKNYMYFKITSKSKKLIHLERQTDGHLKLLKIYLRQLPEEKSDNSET